MGKQIAIIGSNGAIGQAFIALLTEHHPEASIHAFSRQPAPYEDQQKNNIYYHCIKSLDSEDDETILVSLLDEISKHQKNFFDLVIVATGKLHDAHVQPEKSLSQVTAKNLKHILNSNTVFPALIAKHFIPRLSKKNSAIFAVLSARVGSISDNYLGGWYAYRASKAALNMLIKTASIEARRLNKQAIIIGLHPGTVDSKLSAPFQANMPDQKLFSPRYAAEQLWLVLNNITTESSGKCFAWDGKEVLP